MKTIWKYELPITDTVIVKMPDFAALLDVQTQGSSVCLWAHVDPEQPKLDRKLAIVGTGHNADHVSECQHVGTFQLHGGSLIFHVFDLGYVCD